jgi:hypothetical protein
VIDDAVIISLTERDAPFSHSQFDDSFLSFPAFFSLYGSYRSVRSSEWLTLTLRAKYIGQQSKAKPYFTL